MSDYMKPLSDIEVEELRLYFRTKNGFEHHWPYEFLKDLRIIYDHIMKEGKGNPIKAALLHKELFDNDDEVEQGTYKANQYLH